VDFNKRAQNRGRERQLDYCTLAEKLELIRSAIPERDDLAHALRLQDTLAGSPGILEKDSA
jgi:hypothetical protein